MKYEGIDFSNIFKELTALGVGSLNHLREHILTHSRNEEKEIEARVKKLKTDKSQYTPVDFDDYFFSISADHEELEFIKKVADELLVVGLYKLVELNMKKVLCKAYDKEIGRSEIMGYSIKNIKKTLKDHGVSLSAIKNYSSIDELRVLNNAIKHEGKATKQLAAFPNWQTGAELTKLDIVFDRIAPVVPEFIEYLAKDLIS